jgi:hypothetical protein
MNDDGGASSSERSGDRRRLIGAGLSLVIVITIFVLALQGGGGGSGSVDTAPHLVDEAGLRSLAGSLGYPIYWAGPPRGYRMELTEEADGSVYLRYLSPGAKLGDPRPRFLTVGTYPVADAQAALRRTAAKAGSSVSHVAGGGLVLVNPAEAESVYLAYPKSDLQIEVYDPEPGRALGFIRSGGIGPVE